VAEKRTNRDEFVAERTRIMARVVLTRRDDLAISRPSEGDADVDLLVDIRDRHNPGLRRFGVLLRGASPPATPETLKKTFNSALRSVRHLKHVAFPVCLLYFTMQDNQGYFAWLIEPVLTEEGNPKLASPTVSTLVPLDDAALTEIVDRVRAWYDALVAALKA
jgi:hypothetical protein